MKYLKLIMTASFVVAFAGCSSMQSTDEHSGLDAHKTDAQLNAKKYGVQVGIYSMADIGTTLNCPQDKKIETEKNWKTLMSYADGCIVKNQWSMVNLIGQKLSQVEPDAPWGAYYLSVAAEKNGNLERAIWMVDLARRKANGIGILEYQKGRLLWQQQFYKEAISEIEKAISLDNGIKDAHLFLGQVYLSQLNFEKAEGHFKTVLNMDSKNYAALVGYASCEIELEKAQDAISTLENAISKYPQALDLRLQEIYVYENLLKEPEAALKKYKRLQSLMGAKKVAGNLPFNISDKIKDLEIETQKTRQVASEKVTTKK